MDDTFEGISVGEWCFVRAATLSEWVEAIETQFIETEGLYTFEVIAEQNLAARLAAGRFPILN